MKRPLRRRGNHGKDRISTYWELLIGGLAVGLGAVFTRVIVFLVTIK